MEQIDKPVDRLTSHTAWTTHDETTTFTKSVKGAHHKRFMSRFVRFALHHFLLRNNLHGCKFFWEVSTCWLSWSRVSLFFSKPDYSSPSESLTFILNHLHPFRALALKSGLLITNLLFVSFCVNERNQYFFPKQWQQHGDITCEITARNFTAMQTSQMSFNHHPCTYGLRLHQMAAIHINTFTAIVDLSRFNNPCLKSLASTLVDLTFQSRALRSFSLNQLRNLSL